MPKKKDYTDPNTRCKYNHEPDWYTSPKGWTVCRECRRNSSAQYQKYRSDRYKAYQKKRRIENREYYIEYDKRRSQTPERKRYNKDNSLRKKYGITLEEYEKIWEEQDGKCKICLNGLENTRTGAALDHCHNSLKIRGILCNKCNSLLGFCDDNIRILKSAISYLEKVF